MYVCKICDYNFCENCVKLSIIISRLASKKTKQLDSEEDKSNEEKS